MPHLCEVIDYAVWPTNSLLHKISRVAPAGEHTCIVVKPLASAAVEGVDWLDPFVADFRVRLMALLPSAFRCACVLDKARPSKDIFLTLLTFP